MVIYNSWRRNRAAPKMFLQNDKLALVDSYVQYANNNIMSSLTLYWRLLEVVALASELCDNRCIR